MKAALHKAVKSTVIPTLVGLLGICAVVIPGAFIARSILDGTFLGNVEILNELLWPLSNIFVYYIAIVLFAFVAGYGLLFHWRATAGGRSIFYFTSSLLGVMLLVVVALATNPDPWWKYPGDVIWFRPLLRAIVYGAVAVTVSRLFINLTIRYFRPTMINLDVLPRDHTTRIPGSLRAVPVRVPRVLREKGADGRTEPQERV